MELRQYQVEALAVIRRRCAAGVTRQLVALPTGTGKTIIFASLARESNCRTLIIAHREELIAQAVDKLRMVWPGIDVGVVMADQNELNRQVVVASVQTACRPNRLEQLKQRGFSLLIIDEAHHAIASTYRDVIEGLGFMADNRAKLLVGVTATAHRSDGVALGYIFKEVVFERSIAAMATAGYLADLRGIRVSTGLDLGMVGTSHGDFVESQLASVVNCENRNEIILDSWLKHANSRKTLAFCVDVQHAEDLANTFQRAGVPAEAVYGDMPKDNRRDRLGAFHRGEISVLTNCNLLTEGYDEPATDCLLMARPTKSTGLYIQMAGRGTRLYPTKKDCLLIDFTDSRHDVCQLATLAGVELKDGQSLREAIVAAEERKHEELLPASGVHVKEFDLFGTSVFRWIQTANGWRLPLEPKCYIAIRSVGNDLYRVGVIQDDVGTPLSDMALSLGYAQGIGEDYARRNGGAFARRDAKWLRQPATPKQCKLLKDLGLPATGLTKGQASEMIAKFLPKKRRRFA